MSGVSDFQKEKDELFGTTEDSPLTAEQKKEFSGLKYFPEDGKYRAKAKLKKKEGGEMIDVKTSAGDTEAYKRYGKLLFTIEGKELTLNVYQSTDSNHLFLPFRDKTNESTTYHDGRYVEVEDVGGEVDLDFNYAYNPYCAYNDNFRCPITPDENMLDIEVKAGEKRYH
jgi:uncharacterized protein (DUF1684 family)